MDIKTTIAFLILSLGVLPCHGNGLEDSPVCPQLDSILNTFIEQDSSKTQTVELVFERINGIDLMHVSTAWGYKTYFTDGYFFKGKKLITYYSRDRENREGIIDKSRTNTFHDSIPGYRGEAVGESNYIPIVATYQIVSPNHFILLEDMSCLKKTMVKATDKNAIKNSSLNKVLNEYINTHGYVLYEITFTQNGMKIFADIKGGFYYDKNYVNTTLFHGDMK